MKRISYWIALSMIALSLTSCGLPGAAVRSVGRLAQSAGGLIPAAAAAAAL